MCLASGSPTLLLHLPLATVQIRAGHDTSVNLCSVQGEEVPGLTLSSLHPGLRSSPTSLLIQLDLIMQIVSISPLPSRVVGG